MSMHLNILTTWIRSDTYQDLEIFIAQVEYIYEFQIFLHLELICRISGFLPCLINGQYTKNRQGAVRLFFCRRLLFGRVFGRFFECVDRIFKKQVQKIVLFISDADQAVLQTLFLPIFRTLLMGFFFFLKGVIST